MFDSHFHLTDPRLNSLGVSGNGVEIGASYAELPAVFAYAAAHDGVYCTAGVHPAYANDYSQNDFENFVAAHLADPKFVAIGECGLDYHRADLPAREVQIAAFVSQIALAHKYHLPLVVHSREAWADTAAILVANKKLLNNGVLIHCMSYTAAEAQSLLADLGNVPLYFAFGGHLTYKNKQYLHETLRAIPRDRILIETDAPYLAPVPKLGEVNRPEYINYTARVMADILNLTVPEIDDLTRANAYRFYQI